MTDANQVGGRSICAKMLIKTVRRWDVSAPEASFELSGLALWYCSRQFAYLLMSGSIHLECDGDTATGIALVSTWHDHRMNTALLHPRMARFLWLAVVQHMHHGHWMRTIAAKCYCCTGQTGSTLRKMLNHGLTALDSFFPSLIVQLLSGHRLKRHNSLQDLHRNQFFMRKRKMFLLKQRN